jgi:hypothetical protein
MQSHSTRSRCKSARLDPTRGSADLCDSSRVKEPPVISQQEQVEALIEKSLRSATVSIRRTFLQQGHRSEVKPGPLSILVHHHDERALDLYLLTRLVAGNEPFKAQLPAGVWARALGLRGPSGVAAVSRMWQRLGNLRLIARGRHGRSASVTLLLEDGSGDPFTRLGGRADPYLRIPLEYWRDGWYRQMDLPTKAILLIALGQRDDFNLPSGWVFRWYGLSPDTAERGLTKLRELGLLDRQFHYKAAPLTAQGWTKEYTYTLKPPFGPQASRPRRPTMKKMGVRPKV